MGDQCELARPVTLVDVFARHPDWQAGVVRVLGPFRPAVVAGIARERAKIARRAHTAVVKASPAAVAAAKARHDHRVRKAKNARRVIARRRSGRH